MNDRIYVLRQSVVKLTQMLAGQGIQVTRQGITAYVITDLYYRSVVVNLSYMPGNATDELIEAIQGFLDYEVAQLLFSDFTVTSPKTGGIDAMRACLLGSGALGAIVLADKVPC